LTANGKRRARFIGGQSRNWNSKANEVPVLPLPILVLASDCIYSLILIMEASSPNNKIALSPTAIAEEGA